jgi:hypothetical protein
MSTRASHDPAVRTGIDIVIGRLIVAAGGQLAKGERGRALDLLSVLVLVQSIRDEYSIEGATDA